MSEWTHVNASIRIDSIRCLEGINIEKIYSVICNKHIFGSEGGLECNIWDNPNKNCIAAFTFNIFGDLRDYDDSEEILNWFSDICNKLFIRSAIIEIDMEYNTVILARWDSENKELIKYLT